MPPFFHIHLLSIAASDGLTADSTILQERQDFFVREFILGASDIIILVVNHLTSKDVDTIAQLSRLQKKPQESFNAPSCVIVVHNWMNVTTSKDLAGCWEVN